LNQKITISVSRCGIAGDERRVGGQYGIHGSVPFGA
jgi:hypothetical protein